MTRPQLDTLAAVLRSPGASTAALAAATGTDRDLTLDRLRALERRGHVARTRPALGGRRALWVATDDGVVAVHKPPARYRPTPVVDDVLDSLRALGGSATTAQIVEDTGRSAELVRKALKRGGAVRVGAHWQVTP